LDLDGSGLDPGILGFPCFLNSRVLTFLLKYHFHVIPSNPMSMSRDHVDA